MTQHHQPARFLASRVALAQPRCGVRRLRLYGRLATLVTHIEAVDALLWAYPDRPEQVALHLWGLVRNGWISMAELRFLAAHVSAAAGPEFTDRALHRRRTTRRPAQPFTAARAERAAA